MKLLTNEQQELYQNTKVCYICKEKFKEKYKFKTYYKVMDHCHYTRDYRGASHGIC